MLRISIRPPEGTPSASHARPMTQLLQRSRPVRCLLISGLSIATGWLMLTLLLPCLSPSDTADMLLAHLPASETPPLLFWLKISASRLPFWLLIAAAGFTRFSGGLTSAVAAYRGSCDGAVLGLLTSEAMSGASPLPEELTNGHLLTAFGIWAASDLSIRLTMTLAARQVAQLEWTACTDDGRMAPSDQRALWKYLLLCCGGLLATLATCGIYTAYLYF